MAKKKGKSNSIDIHVGKQLRCYRILRGESQQALAEVIDVTFQQIQKYEKGSNRISAGNLYKLHKHFNVSLDYFFQGLDNNISPINNPFDIDNKENQKLLRLYHRISDPERRKAMLDLMKSIGD